MEYGHRIGDPGLAKIVILLYKASRADSTRKTYAVGQRHWARFHKTHPAIAFFPFTSQTLNPAALALCFFVAYLAMLPTIRRYTTVRSYLCHVKALWRDAGCDDSLLHTPLLRAVMRGVRRALPAPPDTREAFILPQYKSPSYYMHPPTGRWLLIKASVTFGFHAMLRFGAFSQFTPAALKVVLKGGQEISFISIPPGSREFVCANLLGIVFTFYPKYCSFKGLGSAFFAHVCDVAVPLKHHCPACVFTALWSHGHLQVPHRPVFDTSVFPRRRYQLI